jgi:hypothetical protein
MHFYGNNQQSRLMLSQSLLLNQACQTFVTEDNWTRNVTSGGCIWQLKYVCRGRLRLGVYAI